MNMYKKLCLLMVTASSTLIAGETAQEFSSMDPEQNIAFDAINLEYEYPKTEVLHSIYKELMRQDVIRIGEGILSTHEPFEAFIVDDDVLKNVYDWALENNFINLDDVALITEDIKPDEFDFFNQNKGFGRCAVAAIACVGEAIAYPTLRAALPCFAAAIEGGTNPYADGWCAAQIYGSAGVVAASCLAGLVNECNRDVDPSISIPGVAGNDSGRRTNGNCGVNARVTKLDIWKRHNLITKIKGYCTDNSHFTVGSTKWAEKRTIACPNGHMVSGVYGRAGDHIDQLGVYCDEILDDGSKFRQRGTFGNPSGGVPFKIRCYDGHLYGFEAKRTHEILRNRKLNVIKPMCKNF